MHAVYTLHALVAAVESGKIAEDENKSNLVCLLAKKKKKKCNKSGFRDRVGLFVIVSNRFSRVQSFISWSFKGFRLLSVLKCI